jgi:hypothetical protein
VADKTDWSKHGAIAGYLSLPVSLFGIGVMLWIGLRNTAQQPTADTASLGVDSVMPLWVALITALVYLVGFIAITTTLILKAYRRESDPPGRLRIISAKWGGSGAFTDVTQTVRENAKPDSAKIPVEVSRFGDPCSGKHKVLHLRYSYDREFAVSVAEGDVLTLPEPIGEEQSNPAKKPPDPDEIEKLRNSGMSPTARALFERLHQDYRGAPWSQKIALKRLCEAGGMSNNALIQRLQSDGFSDAVKVIGQLEYVGFTETSVGGNISPRYPEWIDAILKSDPPC